MDSYTEYKTALDLDEWLASLEHIYQAMQVAEHWQVFTTQMREQIGVAALEFDEPYLEGEQLRFQLQLVQTLERLFDQIARYADATKSRPSREHH